jgi:hypothetical protein
VPALADSGRKARRHKQSAENDARNQSFTGASQAAALLRGTAMLDRLSVNALLKAVIAAAAAAIVIMLAMSAWGSWQRLAAARRVAVVADASGFAFTALHNIRVDRALTVRDLDAAGAVEAGEAARLQSMRASEMPALRSLAELLETITLADGASLRASL